MKLIGGITAVLVLLLSLAAGSQAFGGPVANSHAAPSSRYIVSIVPTDSPMPWPR